MTHMRLPLRRVKECHVGMSSRCIMINGKINETEGMKEGRKGMINEKKSRQGCTVITSTGSN